MKLSTYHPRGQNLLYKLFFLVTKMSTSSHSSETYVAVCQMTSKDNKEENFKCCESLVQNAKKQNASMVFLPEACDYICDNTTDTVKMAESKDGPLVSKYKQLAQKYDVWLSLGGIHLKHTNEKVTNTHLVINNEGDIVGEYNKIHTFDVELSNRSMCESSYVEKGNTIVPPVDTPVGKLGLAVCYDLRFPEIGIALREMGADILTYPSAFMFETGAVHWESLLRSRAIENQCYVIAAAQTGFSTPKRRLWGHAMIIDPSGTITAQCSEGSNIAVAAIDKDSLEKTRLAMPLLSQKRFDLYPKIAEPIPCDNVDQYQFGQVMANAKTVFYITSLTLAIVNKRCVVPGHVLIIPIRPAKRFSDLSSTEVADLFQTVQKVQRVMETVHEAKSSTIVIQDGPDAGQTIWHVHAHILPRKPNDFRDNDDVYRELQNHDKNVVEWRNETDMIKEAEFLKTFFKS
ncbi:deaminated glutathione amidase [Planococcus citri]|uniref:deaminated glutathione amidase n=1 Tax=Planococcus citri TaxID=170843 RepID=UPI0031F88AF0